MSSMIFKSKFWEIWTAMPLEIKALQLIITSTAHSSCPWRVGEIWNQHIENPAFYLWIVSPNIDVFLMQRICLNAIFMSGIAKIVLIMSKTVFGLCVGGGIERLVVIFKQRTKDMKFVQTVKKRSNITQYLLKRKAYILLSGFSNYRKQN